MLTDALRKAISIARLVRKVGPRAAAHFEGYLKSDRIAVSLKEAGEVTMRPRDSDLSTFRQVFWERQYDLEGTAQGRRLKQIYSSKIELGLLPVIVDAGANVGAASIWFAQQFPGSSVYALEPGEENADICRKNCARFANVVVVEGAIGGRSGTASVEAARQSWAFQVHRAENGSGVPILSISDVLGSAGAGASLFIVKVDIEGFEADLFADDTAWVDDVAAIYVEPHDWLFPGKKTSQNMQKALLGRGFEIILRGENLLFVRDDENDAASARAASIH